MDPISLTSGYQGAKFALDSLRALLKMKLDVDTLAIVTQAIQRVSDAQAGLLDAQETIARYQAELAEVKRRLDAVEQWDSKAAQYTLVETAGGNVVYKFSGEPLHFACPACFEKRTISVLQNRRSHSGIFDCKPCEQGYSVEPARPYPPMNYSTQFG